MSSASPDQRATHGGPDRAPAAPAAAAAKVASPCVSICAMDPGTGLCIGCFRTLDEIAAWVSLDNTQRLAVHAAIAERRQAAHAHR